MVKGQVVTFRPSVQRPWQVSRGSRLVMTKAAQQAAGKFVKTAAKSIIKGRKGTSTRTRSKLYQTVMHRDGPTTESFVRFKYYKKAKVPKTVKRLLGEQVMVCNEQTRLTYNANTQATTVLPAPYNISDVGNILAAAATAITASGTSANYKVLLERCNANLMITNQTNDVVRLTLYDCVPRRDIFNASYTPPNNAWVTGDAATSTAPGGGTSAYAYVGSTPFQTPAFTRLYKVQKVTTLDLATGGHHTHVIQANPYRLFDKQTYAEMTSGANNGIGYLTAFTMVVAHGYPTNDGTTKTNVGLAQGALDMVLVKQYKYRMLESSISTISQLTSNLISPGTESIFIDVSGGVSTVATA